MLAPSYLADYAHACEPRLRAFLDGKAARLETLPVDLRPAHALLRDYALRGGKRIRGALVMLGHEAGGGPPEAALDASVGIELLHAYLLIHDDFMDRDEVRRGGPTLHASLAKSAGEHLGGSVAILLGSLCEAWAYELVLAAPGRALEAARLLTEALQEVIVGQALDLLAPLGGELIALQALAIQTLKTGSYSFDLPLRLGATLAGADAAVLKTLRAYALPLGQAFQIADDLLGTFGAPQVTGKPNASDLRDGKRTMLVARALAATTPEDRATLREGLGKAGMTDAEVDLLRAIIRRSGAEEAAREMAHSLCDEAIRALHGLPPNVARHLTEIAYYSVQRSL